MKKENRFTNNINNNKQRALFFYSSHQNFFIGILPVYKYLYSNVSYNEPSIKINIQRSNIFALNFIKNQETNILQNITEFFFA